MAQMLSLSDMTRILPADLMPLLVQACGPSNQASLAAILDSYQADDRQLLGWCDQSGPLALAGMEIRAGAAKLLHLAIRSDQRRCGLGRKLLQAIQSQLGLYRMDAETDTEALGFYQALGWAHVALGPRANRSPRFGVYWLAAEKILQSDFCFPAPAVDHVRLPGFDDSSLSLLRLDQIHPLLSGNKWFKLSGNLIAARQAGLDTLLTLGGAWSNHLIATSAAGRLFFAKPTVCC
ncbi:MAG: hypothetical protein CVV27_14275 [Candidatus Melainabacteria bacterium HGW-Melainabacteria-1]|nr:MAG: hypothetical protein CVV27_14275 [Candidatus Melainabacteria bacterium HGW-Melainabacteria-1]